MRLKEHLVNIHFTEEESVNISTKAVSIKRLIKLWHTHKTNYTHEINTNESKSSKLH